MSADNWQSIHERRNAAYEDHIQGLVIRAFADPGAHLEIFQEAECTIKGDEYHRSVLFSFLLMMAGWKDQAMNEGINPIALLEKEIADIIRSRNPKSEWIAKQRKYEDD